MYYGCVLCMMLMMVFACVWVESRTGQAALIRVKGYDYIQCVNGFSVLWILPAGSDNWRQLDNDMWLSRHYQDINVTLSQWLCLCV